MITLFYRADWLFYYYAINHIYIHQVSGTSALDDDGISLIQFFSRIQILFQYAAIHAAICCDPEADRKSAARFLDRRYGSRDFQDFAHPFFIGGCFILSEILVKG